MLIAIKKGMQFNALMSKKPIEINIKQAEMDTKGVVAFRNLLSFALYCTKIIGRTSSRQNNASKWIDEYDSPTSVGNKVSVGFING